MVEPTPAARGRPPSTTRAAIADVAIELFVRDGFEATTVDAVAMAAGIKRRTVFRYFPSKNDLVWGEFSLHLDRFRRALESTPRGVPVMQGVRSAVLAFNDWGADEDVLRARMTLITTVPTLQAHSTLRYAEWRRVVAEHVAGRLGIGPDDHGPETAGHVALGIALAAYRHWVEVSGDLLASIDQGFALVVAGCPDELLVASAHRDGS